MSPIFIGAKGYNTRVKGERVRWWNWLILFLTGWIRAISVDGHKTYVRFRDVVLLDIMTEAQLEADKKKQEEAIAGQKKKAEEMAALRKEAEEKARRDALTRIPGRKRGH